MMKTGIYYVGDLCYVMKDEWNQICNWMFEENKNRQGEFELADGRRLAIYRTSCGDGLYHSNIGSKHPVDSGTIGCIDTSYLKLSIKELKELSDEGSIVEFNSNFLTHGCDYRNDGIITFGHVEIDTN